MSKVFCRAEARNDLLQHFVPLAQNAGAETADRFLLRAESSFADLAQRPLLGTPVKLRHPALAGMRRCRIRDFNTHLIFYQPRSEGMIIVGVLHAASDWWGVLGLEA